MLLHHVCLSQQHQTAMRRQAFVPKTMLSLTTSLQAEALQVHVYNLRHTPHRKVSTANGDG